MCGGRQPRSRPRAALLASAQPHEQRPSLATRWRRCLTVVTLDPKLEPCQHRWVTKPKLPRSLTAPLTPRASQALLFPPPQQSPNAPRPSGVSPSPSASIRKEAGSLPQPARGSRGSVPLYGSRRPGPRGEGGASLGTGDGGAGAAAAPPAHPGARARPARQRAGSPKEREKIRRARQNERAVGDEMAAGGSGGSCLGSARPSPFPRPHTHRRRRRAGSRGRAAAAAPSSAGAPTAPRRGCRPGRSGLRAAGPAASPHRGQGAWAGKRCGRRAEKQR